MKKQTRCNKDVLLIKKFRRYLTPQQVKSMKGQILSGNSEAVFRAIDKIVEEKTKKTSTEVWGE